MRGTIHTPKRFRQPCSFEGMVFGTISPTDIDACIDFNDRLFVFIEAKSGDVALSQGQRILLERLCRRCSGQAVAFVARHFTPQDEHVVLAECEVESVYRAKAWTSVSGVKVLDYISILLDEHGLDFSVTQQVSSKGSCKHKTEFIQNGVCWLCQHSKRSRLSAI